MIVKPNNYSMYFKDGVRKEVLGGYLLNNERYTYQLIIDKWIFGKPSLIQDENIMYYLVNNISSVGYKVNKDVYNFLTVYGMRYNLLMNSENKHPLMSKQNFTKVEHIELSSYLSKMELQENILGTAEVFSNVH
jgi:hypothetical protein